MARPDSDSPTLFELPDRPDFSIEARAIAGGQMPVAGMDEAGRGPLAGPVVAAAVVLDPDRIPEGLDDSKRLTAATREELFAAISSTALAMSVASVCSTAIDATDIRLASLEAMRRALAGLCIAPKLALADGRDVPPGLCCDGRAVVKGDRISVSIAAASILAKVTRDRMMCMRGGLDPRYGFENHMGYATEAHRDAIASFGPVQRLHRMSFAPLRPAIDATQNENAPREVPARREFSLTATA
ncbi:MAG: ribonuclease HII [Rhizobiaceae bacterium]|nr:ribonuclease HII [Rhizobiaceae bacterium]